MSRAILSIRGYWIDPIRISECWTRTSSESAVPAVSLDSLFAIFSFLEMFLSPFDLLLHALAPRLLEMNLLSLILHFSSISTATYLSARNLDQRVLFSGGAVHFSLLQLSGLVFGC